MSEHACSCSPSSRIGMTSQHSRPFLDQVLMQSPQRLSQGFKKEGLLITPTHYIRHGPILYLIEDCCLPGLLWQQ